MTGDASNEAEYGFVVHLDTQGSGRLSDTEKPEMRRRLYDVSDRAFDQAGIRPPRLYQEDRGDGILSVLTPTVPPRRVVGEWLEYLHQNLRESNVGRTTPLRLRVGLHIGPVTSDAHGRSGRAVDLACRLGDSDVARAILAAAPTAPLVAVVSDRVYEEVVQPGGRWVEPERYRSFDVDLKEGRRSAWFMVPGLPQPPTPAQGATPAADPVAAPGGGPSPNPLPAPDGHLVQYNNNHGNGQFYAGGRFGDIHITHNPATGGDR
ncbi:hypothetical protein AQJ30_10725 [Streptomyces longwoodensis]|uniref:Guanylate cyclase domain-containing protein n=1 Tax=Streptomyces longwoodensis TaxID=68231 RepID=A0A117QP74_9ACTN|nr:hypothetical protein [Streptomyces longwoodensis]KUN39221.1 hypothetical protein AQJ30_10725 [Streptomyces longwoodensis]